jgi:hypothetical protein
MSADLIAFPKRRIERERHQTSIAIGLIWDCIKATIKVTPSLSEMSRYTPMVPSCKPLPSNSAEW